MPLSDKNMPEPSDQYLSAQETLARLWSEFQDNQSYYLSPEYSEAKARLDFIDKFLTCFGWDVSHNTQKNPWKQEVHVERNVGVGDTQKRADYAFFLEPNFKDVRFYVEAKKPSAHLDTADNCFQVTRYGWNSQTPIAFLTNFVETLVLDCRYKPNIARAQEAIVLRFSPGELRDEEQFRELYFLLSREGVADGSLEAFADTLKERRGGAVQRGLFRGGYQSIDDSFLEELDAHRDELARSLKNRNSFLDGHALTEVTQRILDRLVFLRFLEDKLIETDDSVGKLGSKGAIWADFQSTSKRLDHKYNGIVYKPHPLLDSHKLTPDEQVFEAVCEDLADVNSPYNFALIPIHILGSIYERFLGKVIVTTEKRAKIEEKPEVRRAGGVFYTPEYVVRYIVEQTVGLAVKGKTPKEISAMRFADIACGSGSFLLGAYDLLLSYHREWYNSNPKKIRKGECWQDDHGNYRLTLAKRREILLNNIFGIDIDAQAVEVAQLSLYLKLLEEETTASAFGFQREFHEALLPALGQNIVCGNSLIEDDFGRSGLFEDEGRQAVNPMTMADRFPFLRNGGFDAVIGNPPYIRMEAFKPVKQYLAAKYAVHEERADIYAYMLERALGVLKTGGRLGLIVSNKFMKAKYGQPLRRVMEAQASIERYVDLAGADVFHGATVRTVILIATRADAIEKPPVLSTPVPDAKEMRRLEAGLTSLSEIERLHGTEVSPACFSSDGWRIIDDGSERLFSRIVAQFPPLSESLGTAPLFGIKTGLNSAFVIGEDVRRRLIAEDRSSAKVILPYLAGRDLRRYFVITGRQWVIYLHPNKDIKDYPAVQAYLRPSKAALENRALTQKWYELQQPSVGMLPLLAKPKIVYPIIANECRFSIDRSGSLVNDKSFAIDSDDEALVAILNSSLAFFYFSTVCAALEGAGDRYLEFRAQFVSRFPLPPAAENKAAYARLRKLGRLRLDAQEKIESALTERDKDYAETSARTADREIDEAVNKLYGLSPEEIAKVESSAAALAPPDAEESNDD